MIRVFVSSRMSPDELSAERAAAIEAVRHLGAIPIAWELEPASPKHWRQWWRDWIPRCDALIVLLDRTVRDAVIDEVATARQHGVPILVLARNLQSVIDKGLDASSLDEAQTSNTHSGVEHGRSVEDFYTTVNTPKAAEFSGVEGLQTQVKRAISECPELGPHLLASLERIRNTFVAPADYDEWVRQLGTRGLIILAGPPHIGKSASATMLLLNALQEDKDLRFHYLSGPEDASEVTEANRAAILWDDFLGHTKRGHMDADDVGRVFDAVSRDPGERCIVATTRIDVLNEYRDTPGILSEIAHRLVVLEIDPATAYEDEQLREILQRHIDWFSSHPTSCGPISEEHANLAREQAGEIVKRLPFPHNIEVFCGTQLPNVTDQATLQAAVAESQEIQTVVMNWATQLSMSDQVLGGLVCLTKDIQVPGALMLARLAGCDWVSSAADPEQRLGQACGPYLCQGGQVGPQHPSYAEAVLQRAGGLPRVGLRALTLAIQASSEGQLPQHSVNDSAVAYLSAVISQAKSIGPQQREHALHTGFSLLRSQPFRHDLLRSLMLGWDQGLTSLYTHYFSCLPPLALWGAGHLLEALRDDIPPGAHEHFEFLLTATQRANSDDRYCGPDHERWSAYEHIFSNLDGAATPAHHMIAFQAHSDPNRFVLEYANDIIGNWEQLDQGWVYLVQNAMTELRAEWRTRERACFAVAQACEELPDRFRQTLAAAADSERPCLRVPALRAIWRHRDCVPDLLSAVLTRRVASADPALLDALFRAAEWWDFPIEELEQMQDSIGDGELALLREYRRWADSNRQDFDESVLAKWQDRAGPICYGAYCCREWSHSRDVEGWSRTDGLEHPNVCVRLAALLAHFIEAPAAEVPTKLIPQLADCFQSLPPFMNQAALVEIVGQKPKLLEFVMAFLLHVGCLSAGDYAGAIETGQKLASGHKHWRRRFHPAYPVLYLALRERGENADYADCIVARLRWSSVNLI